MRHLRRLSNRDLGLEFEIPFRELGFHGVPHRQTGFLMPSVNALVELIDMPFTVITMTEVNVVNLERVGFNLKNFDMTLVFKASSSSTMQHPYLPGKETGAHILMMLTSEVSVVSVWKTLYSTEGFTVLSKHNHVAD